MVEQENNKTFQCIPVGCVPTVAVSISGGRFPTPPDQTPTPSDQTPPDQAPPTRHHPPDQAPPSSCEQTDARENTTFPTLLRYTVGN